MSLQDYINDFNADLKALADFVRGKFLITFPLHIDEIASLLRRDENIAQSSETLELVIKSDSSVANLFTNYSFEGIEDIYKLSHRFPSNSVSSINLGNIKIIGESTLRYQKSLHTVFAQNVEEVEGSALMQLSNISNFTGEKIKIIGNQAFYGTTALKSFSFGLVEKIGEQGFYNSGIIELIAPNLKTLGNLAFQSCSDLSTVKCIELENIPQGAFRYCRALNNCSFPKVKKINSQAFEGCTSLQELELPKIEFIASNAFGVGVLKRLILSNDKKCTFAPLALFSTNLQEIKVPADLLELYKNDPELVKYRDIITPID